MKAEVENSIVNVIPQLLEQILETLKKQSNDINVGDGAVVITDFSSLDTTKSVAIGQNAKIEGSYNL